MKVPIVLLFTLLLPFFIQAQDNFEHTLSFDEEADALVADINQLSWIAGHWKGEAFGGIVEEMWSPPRGGSMMAAFKLVMDDKIVLYEIETISANGSSLILRLKHFHDNLVSWEEREETVDFRLVKLTDDAVYFDGYTFKRITDDHMDVYVRIDDGGGVEEVKFSYYRE